VKDGSGVTTASMQSSRPLKQEVDWQILIAQDRPILAGCHRLQAGR
jgi:hypothetical protein